MANTKKCSKCKKKPIQAFDPYNLHLCDDCLDDYMLEIFNMPVVVRPAGNDKADAQTKLAF